MMTNTAEKLPEQANQIVNMLTVIEKAAINPDVDPSKMQQLLDVQERIINKQAESSFNRALADLESELPIISHTRKIVVGGSVRSTYTKYEDIHKVLSPLLKTHGFSVSFNTEKIENGINIYGTLSHIEGHSKTAYIPLPVDISGSKNDVQSVGSTISYGKRYLIGMLINLVTQGEDDDGLASGPPIAEKLKAHNRAVQENFESVYVIKQSIRDNQFDVAAEAICELDRETRDSLWLAPTKGGVFTVDEMKTMRSKAFRDEVFKIEGGSDPTEGSTWDHPSRSEK